MSLMVAGKGTGLQSVPFQLIQDQRTLYILLYQIYVFASYQELY